jgi:hypothetical protein
MTPTATRLEQLYDISTALSRTRKKLVAITAERLALHLTQRPSLVDLRLRTSQVLEVSPSTITTIQGILLGKLQALVLSLRITTLILGTMSSHLVPTLVLLSVGLPARKTDLNTVHLTLKTCSARCQRLVVIPSLVEKIADMLVETRVLLVVVLIIVRKIADMNTRVVIHILRGRVEVSHTLLVLTVAERMEVTHLNLILAIDMTMGTMIALLIMDVLIVTMMKRTSFTLLTTDIPDATTSPIDHGRPCPLVSAVSSSTIPSSQMIVATDVIHPSPHTSSVPAIMTSTHVGSVRVTTTSSLATPFPARMASTHASSNLVGTATRHLGLLAHHPALLSTTTSILTLLLSARHPFATSPSAHPLILTPAAAAPHPPASNPRHVSTPS